MAEFVADRGIVHVPILPKELVDAKRRNFEQSVSKVALWQTVRVVECARRQQNCLVQAVCKELFFKFGETIEYLNSALRITEVENLVSATLLLDHLDVGDVIVTAHFGPGKLPEFLAIVTVLSVLSAVLRATIVSNPDIIASICQLQHHWLIRVVVA